MDTNTNDETWREHPALLRAAAWAPDRDEFLQRWEELEQRAVYWIEERARIEGKAAIVLLPAAKAYGGDGPVQQMAGRVGYTYPRDRASVPSGPTLVYHPDTALLTRAKELAHGSSLVALEGYSMPLAGWALGVRAVDLMEPDRIPVELHPELRKSLDHTIFFTGRNNWTGPHEREDARRALRPHVSAGRVDIDVVIGYALAHSGVSELGAKKLRTIVESLSR